MQWVFFNIFFNSFSTGNSHESPLFIGVPGLFAYWQRIKTSLRILALNISENAMVDLKIIYQEFYEVESILRVKKLQENSSRRNVNNAKEAACPYARFS